jgi:flagellar biosynthesis regulator FlbT
MMTELIETFFKTNVLQELQLVSGFLGLGLYFEAFGKR